MADALRLPLELFYEREARHPNKRYMVQPLGGGQLLELSWADVGEQARRAASWLRSRELPQGSRIAIISKNCAHWIVADLAIWMAGHVSVPLYPNLTADSMGQVLEHSEAALAFVGKLDDWASMAPGLPVPPRSWSSHTSVMSRGNCRAAVRRPGSTLHSTSVVWVGRVAT